MSEHFESTPVAALVADLERKNRNQADVFTRIQQVLGARLKAPDSTSAIIIAVGDLVREAHELMRWKDSQMSAWASLDIQEIAGRLGAVVGQDCYAVIQKRVPEVLKELEELKTILAKHVPQVTAEDVFFNDNPNVQPDYWNTLGAAAKASWQKKADRINARLRSRLVPEAAAVEWEEFTGKEGTDKGWQVSIGDEWKSSKFEKDWTAISEHCSGEAFHSYALYRLKKQAESPAQDKKASEPVEVLSPALSPVLESPFMDRVKPWLLQCFGPEVANDKQERNFRFIEESLELAQSCGATKEDALKLVEYVFSRPIGETKQEVGGVMVTLAALCLAHDMDMHECGEIELARVWTKIEKIRAKQTAKTIRGPLPGAWPQTAPHQPPQVAGDGAMPESDVIALACANDMAVAGRQLIAHLRVMERQRNVLREQVQGVKKDLEDEKRVHAAHNHNWKVKYDQDMLPLKSQLATAQKELHEALTVSGRHLTINQNLVAANGAKDAEIVRLKEELVRTYNERKVAIHERDISRSAGEVRDREIARLKEEVGALKNQKDQWESACHGRGEECRALKTELATLHTAPAKGLTVEQVIDCCPCSKKSRQADFKEWEKFTDTLNAILSAQSVSPLPVVVEDANALLGAASEQEVAFRQYFIFGNPPKGINEDDARQVFFAALASQKGGEA